MAQQQFPLQRGFGNEEDWEVERLDLPDRMELDDEELEESIEEQYAQNPRYYHYLLYQEGEEEENRQQDEEAYDIPPDAEVPLIENENWDEFEYPVRFDWRRGFYVDDYDSGIDEPNDRHEPYNDFLDSLQHERIDEENRELKEFLLSQHQPHHSEDQN